MTTTIEKVEASLKNSNEWTITYICPAPGAIIVINSAFTQSITTYRKGSDGKYSVDKVMRYNDAAKAPMAAMIAAHNRNEANQKEAELFESNFMEVTK